MVVVVDSHHAFRACVRMVLFQAVWRFMARQTDMAWFLAPPQRTIEGYADVVEHPISMQCIARKLFRGRFRKSKMGAMSSSSSVSVGGDAPHSPGTPVPWSGASSVGESASGGDGEPKHCVYCQSASFATAHDLAAHLMLEHYYADEFDETTKRRGRFRSDMLLIFKNCRTFNAASSKFCKIADDVRCAVVDDMHMCAHVQANAHTRACTHAHTRPSACLMFSS